MSTQTNATLTFTHFAELALAAIAAEIGADALPLMQLRTDPDDYPCVRYAEGLGGLDAGQQYTVVRLNFKAEAHDDWLIRQAVQKFQERLNLTSLNARFEGYLPEKDWAHAPDGAPDAPLTGDHIRVTSYGSTLWQVITDLPELYHVAMTLRLYHD